MNILFRLRKQKQLNSHRGWTGKDVYNAGSKKNGLYVITNAAGNDVKVYCNMELYVATCGLLAALKLTHLFYLHMFPLE